MRLQCRNTKVASIQSQSLAPKDDQCFVKTAVPSSFTKGRTSTVFDQKKEGRSNQGGQSDRYKIEIAQTNPMMIYTGFVALREKKGPS